MRAASFCASCSEERDAGLEFQPGARRRSGAGFLDAHDTAIAVDHDQAGADVDRGDIGYLAVIRDRGSSPCSDIGRSSPASGPDRARGRRPEP